MQNTGARVSCAVLGARGNEDDITGLHRLHFAVKCVRADAVDHDHDLIDVVSMQRDSIARGASLLEERQLSQRASRARVYGKAPRRVGSVVVGITDHWFQRGPSHDAHFRSVPAASSVTRSDGRRADGWQASDDMIREPLRRHPVLAAVVAAALVGFGAYGLAADSKLTVSYLVIVAGGAMLVGTLDRGAQFSLVALVGLALWGIGHLAGGIVELDGDRILYNALLPGRIHFDNVVHFIGFGAAGLAAWEALLRRSSTLSPWATWFSVWFLAMGVGALNEVIEFGITHVQTETQIGGFQNTGRDLVANMLGGAVAGVIAASTGRGQPWREQDA